MRRNHKAKISKSFLVSLRSKTCARAFAFIAAWSMFAASFIPAFVSDASAQTRRARATSKNAATPAPLSDEQRIAHVLSRITFGARPQDFERVRAIGVDAFIAQQLDPDSIDDSALDARLKNLPTLSLPTPTIAEVYNPKPAPMPSPKPSASPTPSPSPSPKPAANSTQATAQNSTAQSSNIVDVLSGAPKQIAAPTATPTPQAKPSPTPRPPHNPQEVVTDLQRAAFLRAVYSERQLNEMMVAFWENHFSIYSQKDADRWLLTQFDREAIRPFALGKFRDLLEATAKSPAMLYYLDNWQSSAPKTYPATKDRPARTVGGLNENYARELMELHTLGVDGGYTQKDVVEVARCFTGWTIAKPNEVGLFMFNPNMHDNGEKIVLGHRIPAGGGIKDAEMVLDILAAHPSTARFVAKKLCRRFISDDPPQSAINRAADVFLKTGGDIRETVRAILTAPEFYAASAYQAKVRSPFEYAAAALRTFNADTDGNRPVLDWIARMGQPIFGRLTPDGYPDRADEWLSTGNLLERLNFANALANNRIKGTRIDFARYFAGVDINDPHEVAAQLARLALGVKASRKTNDALDKIASAVAAQTIAPPNPAANFTSVPVNQKATNTVAAPAYISDMITLVVGSPEFQRR
jgi:uncharacterized protein (DUF1800 family)